MATAAQKQPAAQNAEAEIRELIKEWSAALEAKDIDRFVTFNSHDIHLFDVKPPHEVVGVDAYKKVWEEFKPCMPAKFKSEHRDLKIVANGDVAFVYGYHRLTPVGGAPQSGPDTWIRVTAGYQKIDGRWKSVHEHVSLPFDPETGKVVMIQDL